MKLIADTFLWMRPGLQAAAVLQALIALINLRLVRIMRWKQDVTNMPLLIREVFHVHRWFISVTVAIFAVMTWRFAADMALGTNLVARWLAAAIGIFWGLRTILQVIYYSSSHWRGQPARTLVHGILLIVYGGMTLIYLKSGLLPG
ncbi:MAG TPA: hypothetical protein VGM03_07760 [Phycisphaerae bacterium]|jgi:hypothetical protein